MSGFVRCAFDTEKTSLTVFSTNKAAINLHRKFGFEIEGISKNQFRIEGKNSYSNLSFLNN